MSETGTCEKCASEISLEADRCPECGHEPSSSGILAGLLSMLATIGFILLAGFILIIWVVAIGTSFEITSAIYLTVFVLFLLLFPAGVLVAKMNQELKTPTGGKKDWREEIFGDN
ncbi:hypothetical protein [Halorubrum ezzemoulense]|nr:hypothetical protein [Halorubrum ezzemoulense]